MAREPLVVTPHGSKIWCEVGDKEIDIELPNGHGKSCPECNEDVMAVRRFTSAHGLLKCDQN